MKAILVLIITISFAHSVFAQGRVVDTFALGDERVSVYFYDPFEGLGNMKPGTGSMTDKDKAAALNDYLHNNPLYLVRFLNPKTGATRHLCIRGNPEKVKTKMFYKGEYIKDAGPDFDPTSSRNYSDKIVKVIDQVNFGGSLFENMSIFADEKDKKFVGNGIQLFGVYWRVTPYSEVKSAILSIANQLSDQ